MAVTAIVYDITGVESPHVRRSEYLIDRLRSKEIEAFLWSADLAKTLNPTNAIIFAHISDLSNTIEQQLQEAAGKGALVVFYSAGSVREEQVNYESGTIFRCYWSSLDDAIEDAPPKFGKHDLRQILGELSHRAVLIAVGIISWCITVSVNSSIVTKRQQDWRVSPERWINLFGGIDGNAFWRAVSPAGMDSKKWPNDLSELEHLINWMTRPPDKRLPKFSEPPDFVKVLDQLRGRYGWGI